MKIYILRIKHQTHKNKRLLKIEEIAAAWGILLGLS